MHPWADQALQNRWAICKRHRKVEPQGQDHLPAMDGIQTHFIAEYTKMLAANGGTTMGQEGYGTGGAYNEIDDDGSYLA